MSKFRNLLLIVAIGAAALGGVFLLNLVNSNNAIDTSSANVYNIVGLSQIEDDALYFNKIVIDVNSQILTQDIVLSGNLEISFDKNALEVEDIIMPANIIAVNQKIDTAEGTIKIDVSSTNAEGFRNISNLARIVFTKKIESSEPTSITLLSTSTLGNPNTLDSLDKSLTISF